MKNYDKNKDEIFVHRGGFLCKFNPSSVNEYAKIIKDSMCKRDTIT